MPSRDPISVTQLQPNQALLNSRFEGYKLHSTLIQHVSAVSLEFPIDIEVYSAGEFSMKKLQDRAHFNHLHKDIDRSGACYYISKDYKLIKVKENSENIERPSMPLDECEYPTISFPPSSELLCISNGAGLLTILNCKTFEKLFEYQFITPFIMSDCQLKGDCLQVAMYCTLTVENKIQFHCKVNQLNLTNMTLEKLLEAKGPSPPLYFSIGEEASTALLGSDIVFETIHDSSENSTSNEPTLQPISAPYQWTQNGQEITIQTILTKDTQSRHVHCRFTRIHLMVSVLIPNSLKIFDQALFDEIEPSECIWTLEENKILTLYIQKKSNCRWVRLFESDDDVMETIDPSELVDISDRMSKYTTDDFNASPSANQTVLSTEKAEAIDFEGQGISIVSFSLKTGASTHINYASGHEWICSGALPNQILLGFDVDALVYSFNSLSILDLKHEFTFNAFNFVKNSKRDRRLITYTQDKNYAIVVESSRYLYIYSSITSVQGYASQAMVDMWIDPLTGSMDVDTDSVDYSAEYVLGIQEISEKTLLVMKSNSFITIKLA